ncbi:tRNA (guanine(26)-N(2))-dimethyltransferase [Dictyocoela muelleri]|nr:tRNA (guanine(26)-N(2))-dimethyltransferase [Dictyocoela muelleri]
MKIEENGVIISKSSDVFYNPSQTLNRTLSVIFLKTIPNRFTLLECMSATGLRSILYLKNLNAKITLNDKSKAAYTQILQNLKINNFINFCEKEKLDNRDQCESDLNPIVYNLDCNILMLSHSFDVIDIDPFGSPMPYLRAAFRSVKHKGILCITATDTAVLCCNRNKCFLKYSVLTRKTQNYDQIAIRVLLGAVCIEASRNNCYIEPLFSVSIDFYVRIFIRVYKQVKLQVAYYKMCYCLKYCEREDVVKIKRNNRNCKNNNNYKSYKDEIKSYKDEIKSYKDKIKNNNSIPSSCDLCNQKILLCGPFYDGSLNNRNIIQEMIVINNELIKNEKNIGNEKINGLLTVIKNELNIFESYNLSYLTKLIGISSIPMKKIMSAIVKNNYKVSLVHSSMTSIKTDMPLLELLSLLKGIKDKEIDIEPEIEIIFKDLKNRGVNKNGTGPLKKTR